MNSDHLIEFFKWMSIINLGLFVFSTLIVMALRSLVVKIHSKMFGLSETQILNNIYSYLGMFKLLIIVFNLVPYISLLIIQ